MRLKIIAKLLLPECIKRQLKLFNTKKYFYKKRIMRTEIQSDELVKSLELLGVKSGNCIFVHSSMTTTPISGGVIGLVNVLNEVVGNKGNIMVPTFTFYGNTIKDYLINNPYFDARTTPSRMGLLTEVFRRQPEVFRSAHPTHSVAAKGDMAKWLTEDHNKSVRPFGYGTPLHKLTLVQSLIVGIGVYMENVLTSVHVVEDIMEDRFPINVYEPKPFPAIVVDQNGNTHKMHTFVHSENISRKRDIGRIKEILRREGIFRSIKLRGTPLFVIESKPLLDIMIKLAGKGETIYGKIKNK